MGIVDKNDVEKRSEERTCYARLHYKTDEHSLFLEVVTLQVIILLSYKLLLNLLV